jgi:hypothetical protein
MPNAPRHTVAETASYLSDAAKARVSEDELQAIVDVVAAEADQGVLIAGSGGVRKARIEGRGKGKSGGYRVMIAYVGPEAPAYLLALLGKGDRANFTKAEVNQMNVVTTAIKQHWRKRQKR